MVAAPFSYIGLVIALLLTGGIGFGVWFLVKKMVGPQPGERKNLVSSQQKLPAETVTDREKLTGEASTGEKIAAVAEVSHVAPDKP